MICAPGGTPGGPAGGAGAEDELLDDDDWELEEDEDDCELESDEPELDDCTGVLGNNCVLFTGEAAPPQPTNETNRENMKATEKGLR